MIDQSNSTYVSVVSVYEIAQKVRLGKWPEMFAIAERLSSAIAEQGYLCAELSASIAQRAGLLEWSHRDPFDRMIAATAIELQVPLMSADVVFDELAALDEWPGRVGQP